MAQASLRSVALLVAACVLSSCSGGGGVAPPGSGAATATSPNAATAPNAVTANGATTNGATAPSAQSSSVIAPLVGSGSGSAQPLPSAGGIGGTYTARPADAPPSGASLALQAASGAAAESAGRAVQDAKRTIFYAVTFVPSVTIALTGLPGFTISLPATLSTANRQFFYALNDPGTGNVLTQGPATVANQQLTFAPSTTPITLQAGVRYVFGFYAVNLTTASLIKHVVVIVQENRTPDNLFNGFPGADTVRSGQRHDGTTVALGRIDLATIHDIDHSHENWWREWNGGAMNGFDLGAPKGVSPDYPYAAVPRTEVEPYWDLALSFTFGDRMFQSNSGPSLPAHLFLISGQSHGIDNNPNHNPWGCDSPPGTTAPLLGPNGTSLPGFFPCFDIPTLGDELDAKNVGWRYYAPAIGTSGSIWSVYDTIRHVRYGTGWTNDVISPETQVLTDVAAGTLAPVTWVVPSAQNSDHAGGAATTGGPDWVGSIVNAIGESAFWSSTAIFIVWDDWGGWYDHVAPPQLDAMGLGFRVPLIVVSPYAKHGYVSHVQHEFGSVLKFTEETFGLPSLGTTDARADDFADCFDFTQTPLTYYPISGLKTSQILRQAPSAEPPDTDE